MNILNFENLRKMTYPTNQNQVFVHVDTKEVRSDNMNAPLVRLVAYTFDEHLFSVSFSEDEKENRDALQQFNDWCVKRQCRYFWGCSSTDSMVRLQLVYQTLNLGYPWSWRNVRDATTVLSMYNDISSVKKEATEEYCHHIVDKLKRHLSVNKAGTYLYENWPFSKMPMFNLNHFVVNLVFLSVGVIFGTLVSR